MAIEAPVSKFRKNNLKVYTAACIIFAIVFAYDGYLSKYQWSMRYSFYEEHVLKKGGKPDDTMVWNQKWLPLACGGIAVLFGATLFAIRNKKIVADENELVISNKEKISYDSIQKIDKTNFGSKGFFIITYKNKNGSEVNRKLSDRTYDNLTAILDKLVAKIS
jgi:hypothetical protein